MSESAKKYPPPKNTSESPDNTPILEEIETIAAIEDDNLRSATIEQFIQRRKVALADHMTHQEISFLSRSTTQFIAPDAGVRANFLVDPLLLDDDDVYRLFFETLREFRSHAYWVHEPIRSVLPHVFLRTVAAYFGNYDAGPDSESRRKQLYLDHTTSDSQGISIKEFRGTSAGYCVEKAASAHNLFLLLGYAAELIISENCRLENTDHGREMHVFNLLRVGDKYILIDLSNPVGAVDKAGGIKSFYPAIYNLTPEQQAQFVAGKRVAVHHPSLEVDENGAIQKAALVTREYGR